MTDNHIAEPPPGLVYVATMQGTGRVIANFAVQHLKAAALFRDQVARMETENMGRGFGAFFEDIRSYASACVMSSARNPFNKGCRDRAQV